MCSMVLQCHARFGCMTWCADESVRYKSSSVGKKPPVFHVAFPPAAKGSPCGFPRSVSGRRGQPTAEPGQAWSIVITCVSDLGMFAGVQEKVSDVLSPQCGPMLPLGLWAQMIGPVVSLTCSSIDNRAPNTCQGPLLVYQHPCQMLQRRSLDAKMMRVAVPPEARGATAWIVAHASQRV